jgi:hypothetical protein
MIGHALLAGVRKLARKSLVGWIAQVLGPEDASAPERQAGGEACPADEEPDQLVRGSEDDPLQEC